MTQTNAADDQSAADAFINAGGWPAILGAITTNVDLNERQARAAMNEILAGRATNAQIAGLIVGLRLKGESVNELVGLARGMVDSAQLLQLDVDVIDIVGTGGSVHRQKHALNVSTMASFVAAGAGARVCKHGNYRASSTSGAFDFLAALGINVDLEPAQLERCVTEIGIGFALARTFHPAMRFAGPVRTELGIPTVFNVLGPLAHPAQPKRQLIGTANEALASRMAEVYQRLGSELAWVVSGAGGLDEISTTGPSIIYVATPNGVRRTEVDVVELGITPPSSMDELAGGGAEDNVAIFERILDGTDTGPRHDIVVLNAGAALAVAGLADDLGQGIEMARAALADGRVATVLERLRTFTNQFAAA
ncbi:MAG: anthranilate phosphoribosyltransferase [Acidimicrobiales bacterium]